MSIKKISKKQPDSFKFNERNLEIAKKIIFNYPEGKQQSAVMALLYIAQEQNDNWIPLAAMKYIAKFLNIPYIQVYEVATFYHHFDVIKEDQAPPPPLTVRVCESISCEMSGAKKLTEDLRQRVYTLVRCPECAQSITVYEL